MAPCTNMPQRATPTRPVASQPSRSTSSMPLQPKTRTSSENMKQKSLINFFGKPAAKPAGAPTPASKSASSGPMRSQLASGSASSDVEYSVKDTPPTSDPIDVDMLSDDQAVKSPTRCKPVSRYIVPTPPLLFHFHSTEAP